ncbi:hypothetical protein CesoFtcFv8_014676 [Champsocephalus esox]|uniref:Uncharacterized protein n=1 Tax=Champsocephalus esox TaxID=159716 RepID=A0AAN8BP93_9TELE|nr:hypothetical protein CesoFtcFv8_014676 [Champsocephalus esox]
MTHPFVTTRVTLTDIGAAKCRVLRRLFECSILQEDIYLTPVTGRRGAARFKVNVPFCICSSFYPDLLCAVEEPPYPEQEVDFTELEILSPPLLYADDF